MKKVFLYAYDQVNLGDDLFIETLLKKYPHIQFIMISQTSYGKMFKEYDNLKIIDDKKGFYYILSKIKPSIIAKYKHFLQKKSAAVVYIGGSIFIEYPEWSNIANWWKFVADNYNLYVLGANFGPYHTVAYKNAMEKCFEKCKDVCFRDRYSKHLFESIGTVRYAADILFSYDVPLIKEHKKQIFVSMISCEDKDLGRDFKRISQSSYERKMIEIIQKYISKGYNVLLASFCEKEGDLKVVSRIMKKVQCEKIKIVSYNGYNRKEFLVEMMSSEYIISARFHGIILGMVAGIPVYPIIYSDKTKYVLEDVGFAGKIGDLRKIDEINFENSFENLRKEYCLEVNNQIKESKAHFVKLDHVLGE